MPESLSEVGLAIKNFLKILENAAGTCFFQKKKRNKIKNPLLNIAIIHLTFFHITGKN